MRFLPTKLVLGLLALMFVMPGWAEQRALLVGVGKYEIEKLNLPGIDLDLDRMQDTLKIMGFEPHQIRTLADSEATSSNVKREFKRWLTKGVTSSDRVVFYFSGHGSYIPDYNGDEPDDVDEVLVTHDMKYATKRGRNTLTGVVTDDEIGKLIRMSPSKNILVIVDACHSGTVTREVQLMNRSLGTQPVYEKAVEYDGMPIGESMDFAEEIRGGRKTRDAQIDTFVSISAAGDNEKALGTVHGGIFTVGFTEAIKRRSQQKQPLTIAILRDDAAVYIEQRVDQSKVHHPQVNGSLELANGQLQFLSLENGNGPLWDRLRLLALEGKILGMSSDRTSYKLDEAISFNMGIPEDGYLNIISVDAKDNATVIYPNKHDVDNQVKAGEFVFPAQDSSFEFAAAEPLGPTLVVAFLTKKPLNFRDQGHEGRKEDGFYADSTFFNQLAYTSVRAIQVRMKPELEEVDTTEVEPNNDAPEPQAETQTDTAMFGVETYRATLTLNIEGR